MKNRQWMVGVLGTLLSGSVCGGALAQSQTPQTSQPAPAQSTPAQSTPAQTTSSKSRHKKAPVKKSTAAPANPTASAEPDKVLYDRAMADVKKSRYTEGRLALQTLINTYPDSEYLAKAKLAVADSYYKEGGTSSLTQSISEYQDFITFFPFLDEAAYAQLQIGMAYYRMMEKADRDKSEGDQAETALQTFILKYPQSNLRPKAEQQLRDVQEILADGEYRTARFYYLKQDYRPSAARLVELTERYPLYSESDTALWMLGDIYSRAKQNSKSEDDKNHWSDLAGQCYSRIVQNYPNSKLAPEAKSRLKALDQPIPKPDPDALARMQQEQLYAKQHTPHGMFHMLPTGAVMGMVTGTPDFSGASHFGLPNLQPLDDSVSALDVLKPGAAGPDFTLSARQIPTDLPDAGPAPSGGQTPSSTPSFDLQPQIISTGGASDSGANTTSTDTGGSSNLPTPLAPSSSSADTTASGDPGGSTNLPAPLSPTNSSAATDSSNGASSSSSLTPQAGAGTSAASQQEAQQSEPTKADSSTESTSKKKKGLHKLNPF